MISPIGVLIGFAVLIVLFLIGVPIWMSFMAGAAIVLVCGLNVTGTSLAIQYETSVDSFTLMAMPFFILAGSIMSHGGGSIPIFNFMNSFLGNKRAGIPIAVVFTCMIYAAITGSTLACLSAVTSICLPIMRRAGYSDKYTAAVITVSATMGNLIPPSLLMIVYAGLVGEDVSKLFISGIIPGVICGLILSVVAYVKSPKPSELETVYSPETFQTKNRIAASRKAIPILLMPIIILGTIYAGIMTPTEAAALSCVYGLIICLVFYRELNWKSFVTLIKETVTTDSVVFVTAGAAFILALPITRLGIPQQVAGIVAAAGFGPKALLVAAAILLLVVGCFLDSFPTLYLTVPIILPALRAVGIDMVQFNIILILCLQIGQVTPPFGCALYLGAKLMDVKLSDLIKQTLPYLFTMIALVIAVIFIPWLSLGIVR